MNSRNFLPLTTPDKSWAATEEIRFLRAVGRLLLLRKQNLLLLLPLLLFMMKSIGFGRGIAHLLHGKELLLLHLNHSLVLQLDVLEVLQESFQIKIVFRGLDPQPPVNELEELDFQQVHLFQVNAAHLGHEMVPVEDIIVKLGSQESRR
jgi:hypothetical protein